MAARAVAEAPVERKADSNGECDEYGTEDHHEDIEAHDANDHSHGANQHHRPPAIVRVVTGSKCPGEPREGRFHSFQLAR
jgi:hypothetical protein